MKLLATAILLLTGYLAIGQVGVIETFERDSTGKLLPTNKKIIITQSNSTEYYERAKGFINAANYDSLLYADIILRKLFYFDSIRFSRKIISNHKSEIERQSFNYFKGNIIGQWAFEWSGSNWGTDQTSKTRKEEIVFTDSEAYFYSNDSLKRKTQYLITNKQVPYFMKDLYFQLYFPEDNLYWQVGFINHGPNYLARINFSKQKIGLHINEMPNCSCGCPESIYLKVVSESCTSEKKIASN